MTACIAAGEWSISDIYVRARVCVCVMRLICSLSKSV